MRISRSLVRGQAAEVVIYWTAFPGGGRRLLHAKLVSSDAAVDRRSGGGLLESAWNRARRRARARYGRGSSGEASSSWSFARIWAASRDTSSSGASPWASFWGTEEGDRIRAWIVDVDGRHLFFVAETKEGFNHPLRPPPSKSELQRVGREIAKIVESIRFD